MMRSQFEDTLMVSQDGLAVGGPFTPFEVPASHQYVVWMVSQGDTAASGTSIPGEDTWWASEAVGGDWVNGPAWAMAVTVAMTPAGVLSFTWQDDVVVKLEESPSRW